MLPLLVAVPSPVIRTQAPPVVNALHPEHTVTIPPDPLVAHPVATKRRPARPFVADPDPARTLPLLPILETPELNTRSPLVPLAPPFEVRMLVMPLLADVPSPLCVITVPPADVILRPEYSIK